MKSRGDSRRKQDKETLTINGQVAVMRLLSALFFCLEMAAIESARPVWRAACPQDSSRGIGGCPPTSGVLFVQKDTACQYYNIGDIKLQKGHGSAILASYISMKLDHKIVI